MAVLKLAGKRNNSSLPKSIPNKSIEALRKRGLNITLMGKLMAHRWERSCYGSQRGRGWEVLIRQLSLISTPNAATKL